MWTTGQRMIAMQDERCGNPITMNGIPPSLLMPMSTLTLDRHNVPLLRSVCRIHIRRVE